MTYNVFGGTLNLAQLNPWFLWIEHLCVVCVKLFDSVLCALQWQTLYKLVERWRQKEAERQEVIRQLQLEKHTLQEAFESQQQVQFLRAWLMVVWKDCQARKLIRRMLWIVVDVESW